MDVISGHTLVAYGAMEFQMPNRSLPPLLVDLPYYIVAMALLAFFGLYLLVKVHWFSNLKFRFLCAGWMAPTLPLLWISFFLHVKPGGGGEQTLSIIPLGWSLSFLPLLGYLLSFPKIDDNEKHSGTIAFLIGFYAVLILFWPFLFSILLREVITLNKDLLFWYDSLLIAAVPTIFFFRVPKSTIERRTGYLKLEMVLLSVPPWSFVLGGLLGWYSGENPLMITAVAIPFLYTISFVTSFIGLFKNKKLLPYNALAFCMCSTFAFSWFLPILVR
jgi:hypothetical protein